MNFPAVRVRIGERIHEPRGAGRLRKDGALVWQDGPVTFSVLIRKLSPGLFRKTVTLEAAEPLPTPDWVETDRQTVPDPELSLRGYLASAPVKIRPGAEEEGGGVKPGCGYPLIGRRYFAGIEHPAAFAVLEEKTEKKVTYSLKQHPVWDENNRIEAAPVIFFQGDNAEKAFQEYLNGIRIQPLRKPLFSLCSFWSDPYLGNYEYQIEGETYRRFVDGFTSQGIVPDVYTLDAGWQDRNSLFEPKAALGGHPGLAELEAYIRKCGSRLGLWVSHNGPMGIAPEFMKKCGFPVGSGESSTYCGDGYGVLPDPAFEKALGDRFAELAGQGVRQFKMDWDNDCAVSPEFAEKYPTRNHVREGSVNAMIRISARIRKANRDLVIRSGWWPSPWWLMHVHHIFLPDSNDSEYTSLPSRTQRDSAATYRDTLYYCCFRRDRSAFPLDAIDNHEFPHALRNPFHETPGTAADLMMLTILRGTSYFPLTLQPEAMEEWFARTLRTVMAFARSHGPALYRSSSSMTGGNPNAGEIYGFRYELSTGNTWIVLRNPAPVPREWHGEGERRSGVQIYPFFARCSPAENMLLAPHEVRVLILSSRKLALPFEAPFQVEKKSSRYEFRFPAHCAVTEKTSPRIGAIHQIQSVSAELKESAAMENGWKLLFKLRLPCRMRETTLNVEILPEKGQTVSVEARSSRAPSDVNSCCQLPVTALLPGIPGIGERLNPDTVPVYRERFFLVPCAEGGEAYYTLLIRGISGPSQLKLSVSGFYAPSREAEERKTFASWWKGVLPPVHPCGFPMAERLDSITAE